MIASLQDRPAVRRLAALALLALALWVVLPPLLGPVQAWREARAALASERALAERQARLVARRGAVAALAAQPDVPFSVAPDAASAGLALVQRLNAAAPADSMRLGFDPPQPFDERPGAPVPLRFSFEATEGALYAFLAEIETGQPFVRVDEMQAARLRNIDGTITLAGTATVSAVPLLRAQP